MARPQSRAIDPEKELVRLEKKHQRLKSRVAALEAQVSLTQEEQLELAKLKKQKLATKDALKGLASPVEG